MTNLSSEEDNAGIRNLLSVLKDLVGLFTAMTGIFVVLLYLAGRAYAVGYFSAMNIPSTQVSFTIWEYSEVAWFPIFFYSLFVIMVAALFWGVMFVIMPLIGRFLVWIGRFIIQPFAWIGQFISRWVKFPQFPQLYINVSRSSKAMFFIAYLAFTGLMVLYSVYLSLDYVKAYGYSQGRGIVLEGANQIEVVSVSPEDLGIPTVITSTLAGQSSTLYVYKGFRLLTFNNSTYYLFRDIDDNCKPKQVYVIPANHYEQINIFPSESLVTQKCPLSTPSNQKNQSTPTP